MNVRMASLTRWTWVWARSRRWWWTGKPGVLQSMGLQRVRHDWTTVLTDWLISKDIMPEDPCNVSKLNLFSYELFWIGYYMSLFFVLIISNKGNSFSLLKLQDIRKQRYIIHSQKAMAVYSRTLVWKIPHAAVRTIFVKHRQLCCYYMFTAQLSYSLSGLSLNFISK